MAYSRIGYAERAREFGMIPYLPVIMGQHAPETVERVRMYVYTKLRQVAGLGNV